MNLIELAKEWEELFKLSRGLLYQIGWILNYKSKAYFLNLIYQFSEKYIDESVRKLM